MRVLAVAPGSLRLLLVVAVWGGLAFHHQARAADEEASDAAALSLADSTAENPEPVSDWRLYAEAAAGAFEARPDHSLTSMERLSLSASYDHQITPAWRLLFSDRLDQFAQAGLDEKDSINTLREAYLSWQPGARTILDLGRINVRQGVAAGYNPTDYFRAGAVRSVVSVDPSSLRENRLGSVMVRGQRLWSSGSLTALFSPGLADQPESGAFRPDLGATNARNRWLLVLSQRLTAGFSPQVLFYGGAGIGSQLGLNLTTLVGDNTVAYLEWSGGRSANQLDQALGRPGEERWHNRVATGLTYTTTFKLSLTLEYEYDGAALDAAAWDSLYVASPQAYARYRQWTLAMQELPSRRAWFAYARWQDALWEHLDLTGLVRRDAVDRSQLDWLEARYHFRQMDAALQWELSRGDTASTYGAAVKAQVWQAILTYYF